MKTEGRYRNMAMDDKAFEHLEQLTKASNSKGSTFGVIEHVYPDNNIFRFRIVENVRTVDGLRTRFTEISYASCTDAIARCKELNKGDKA